MAVVKGVIMLLHPSVFRLARRLCLVVPVAGVVSAAVFFASVSKSVFPGYSASLVAAAAGVVPQSRAAHPLFSQLVRQVAAREVAELPLRLNLLSALCGVCCAMMLCYLAGRTILFAACEDPGGGGCFAPTEDSGGAYGYWREMPAEVEAHNRQVLRIAAFGGLAAAVLFSFSLPVWSAATRLDNGLFSLALALASFCLFPVRKARLYDLRVAFSVFLFTLGLFESCAFVLLLPVYAFFLFRTWLLVSANRTHTGAGIVVAGLLGCVCAVYAFRLNTEGAAGFKALHLLHVYGRELLAHYGFEARQFFPRQGWLSVALQVGLPALILLFGRATLFQERKPATAVAMVLVVLSGMPALLNWAVSPYEVYQPSEHLPVFGAAVIAVAAAAVLAACMLLFQPERRNEGSGADVQAEAVGTSRAGERLHLFAGGILIVHLLLCCLSVWRSGRALETRQGGFADEVARAMLDEMRGRGCLVTNGLLDNHLLVQARLLRRPVCLVTLRSRPVAHETAAIGRLIDESPLFEGLNRLRLRNALSIGAVRFVIEWFSSDPQAGDKAMVFATPDLWTASGYRAVPEGLAFGGVRAGAKPDAQALVARNRAFAERLIARLREPSPREGVCAAIRGAVQMKAGFAANELGVFLEDEELWGDAFAAYQRAVEIDPSNASAAINLYELARARALSPANEEALRKRMKAAVANAGVRNMAGITRLLQNYGSIRQPAFYQQQMAVWSSRGARAVAADKARKALSLAERAGAAALVENAAAYLQAGNTAQAEACYLAAVEADAGCRDALVGLCMLRLGQRQAQEAETWRRKALEAGVEPLALRYQTVMIALLKGEKDQALELLKAATREAPADSRYWALLADLLLGRGDVQYVERQLLPDMQQALKTKDHFMIHAVRGMTLQAKGPAHYKEARLSLLNALNANAALNEIWTTLLELDMAIGNAEYVEADMRRALAVDAEHPLANYLMGASLLSKGALRESEDFLRRSLEKRPTAPAHNDLAENLRLQKRLAEAEASARKALELEPGLTAAQDTLACVLCDAGRYQEAESLARKNVEQYPGRMPYQLTLLRAEIGLGKRAEAVKTLERLQKAGFAIPADIRKAVDAL